MKKKSRLGKFFITDRECDSNYHIIGKIGRCIDDGGVYLTLLYEEDIDGHGGPFDSERYNGTWQQEHYCDKCWNIPMRQLEEVKTKIVVKVTKRIKLS